MARRLTREDAVDILRAHMRTHLPVEPATVERIIGALDENKVERGSVTATAMHLNCCDTASKARAFLAGQPVSREDVLSMAALIVALHANGGQKHVA
jgi:hypothetical protein